MNTMINRLPLEALCCVVDQLAFTTVPAFVATCRLFSHAARIAKAWPRRTLPYANAVRFSETKIAPYYMSVDVCPELIADKPRENDVSLLEHVQQVQTQYLLSLSPLSSVHSLDLRGLAFQQIPASLEKFFMAVAPYLKRLYVSCDQCPAAACVCSSYSEGISFFAANQILFSMETCPLLTRPDLHCVMPSLTTEHYPNKRANSILRLDNITALKCCIYEPVHPAHPLRELDSEYAFLDNYFEVPQLRYLYVDHQLVLPDIADVNSRPFPVLELLVLNGDVISPLRSTTRLQQFQVFNSVRCLQIGKLSAGHMGGIGTLIPELPFLHTLVLDRVGLQFHQSKCTPYIFVSNASSYFGSFREMALDGVDVIEDDDRGYYGFPMVIRSASLKELYVRFESKIGGAFFVQHSGLEKMVVAACVTTCVETRLWQFTERHPTQLKTICAPFEFSHPPVNLGLPRIPDGANSRNQDFNYEPYYPLPIVAISSPPIGVDTGVCKMSRLKVTICATSTALPALFRGVTAVNFETEPSNWPTLWRNLRRPM